MDKQRGLKELAKEHRGDAGERQVDPIDSTQFSLGNPPSLADTDTTMLSLKM